MSNSSLSQQIGLEFTQGEIPLILAQDQDWLLVEKPAFWLSVPSIRQRHQAKQLNGLHHSRHFERAESQEPEVSDSGPGTRENRNFPCILTWLKDNIAPCLAVHRLDLETSGIMLFAKTSDAHRRACSWFEKRQIKKTYAFISSKAPGLKPLPHWKSTGEIRGLASQTQFEVERTWEGVLPGLYGLAHPKTGRRHQIRIHLKTEGFPILFDTKYGFEISEKIPIRFDLRRLTLHAHQLEFSEPVMGRKLWTSPLPNYFLELEKVLASLSKGSNET